MGIQNLVKQLIGMTGYLLVRSPNAEKLYDRDGLISIHNHDFMDDPSFQKAYTRGVLAAGDYGWQWRVHIGLWAAQTAARIKLRKSSSRWLQKINIGVSWASAT